MPRFCPNCGSEVDSAWKVCPKCGNNLEFHVPPQPTPQPYIAPGAPPYGAPPQGYQQYPPYSQGSFGPSGSNAKGTVSLILAILGFACCFFLSTIGCIVLGIIAIVLGKKGRKIENGKSLATAGFVIGILDIVFGILFFFLAIALLNAIYI